MPTSPALDQQKEAGVTFAAPNVYSSVADEYEVATQGVGLLDRSLVGRLRLTGADALDLLDRLSTNKLDDLAVGQGMYTVLTSNKGRIMDLLFVVRLDDHLMVFTGPENREKVAEWIDFYIFTEDVAVQDVTEDTVLVSLIGPEASSLVGALVGGKTASLSQYGSAHASMGEAEVLVVRTDFARLPGYDLVVARARAGALWTELLNAGARQGVKPVGMDALEAVRVEQGVPTCGKELTEDANPLEADLLDFISFNKGCYVGQEVVARLNTYEKVQRRLVGLTWEGDGGQSADADISLDGKRVGTVTSEAWSPRMNKRIGLGYVRKAQAVPGMRLTTGSADGEVPVVVAALPFTP